MVAVLRPSCLFLALAAAFASSQEALRAARAWEDAAQPVDTRVAALLAAMTLDEKVGQLLYTYTLTVDPAALRAAFPHGVGSLSLPQGSSISNSTLLRNVIQGAFYNSSALGIPVSFYGETMRSAAVGGCTIFPTPAGLGATWNVSLLYAIGRVVATEGAAMGLDRSLSPVLQVAVDPRWGRVYENFGEDAMLVAALGAAMTKGLLGPGGDGGPSTYLADPASLIVTAKHAVAYGESNSDGYATDASARKLHDIYLRPWRAFAAAGGRGLMVAHESLNMVPMHANAALLNGTLRGMLGLEGALFGSDYDNVQFLSDAFHFVPTHAAGAIAALTAGVDQEMASATSAVYNATLAASVEAGTLPIAAVDAAVTRVLRAKFAACLFDGRTWANATFAEEVVHQPAAVELTREAAAQSLVLLTNGGAPRAPVLPLQLPQGTRVAVLGPNGGGCDPDTTIACAARVDQVGGYSPYGKGPGDGASINGRQDGSGAPGYSVYTVEDALRAEPGLVVTFSAGASISAPGYNASLLPPALAIADGADVVVLVLGDNRATCGEGNADRVSLDLPGSQLLLLQGVLNVTGNLANATTLPAEWGALGITPYVRPGGPIPVVVILIHARPVTFDSSRGNWLLPGTANTGRSALLTAWQPSEQGGLAIVDVLLGRVNPSGRLAQAWIRSAGHVRSPSNPYWQLANSQGAGAWNEPYGDSWEPLFPFAWGMSYTSFTASNLQVSPAPGGAPVPADPAGVINATLSVSNTGSRAGTALMQVYATVRVPGVLHFVNKLAGWEHVALESGAAANVTVSVKISDLDRWDDASSSWVIDAGNYTLAAGLCWSSAGLYATEKRDFPCPLMEATLVLA